MMMLFLTAFGYLFSLRFENGDFLPAYSSLRRDPMGTAVLFESLLQSGMNVQRNHDDLGIASLEPDSTLFIIGLSGGSSGLFASKSSRRRMTDFIQNGGRLVIANSPLFISSRPEEDATVADDSKEEEEPVSDTEAEEEEEPKEPPPVWAASMEQIPNPDHLDTPPLAVGSISGHELSMVWPHAMVFSNEDPGWHALLSIDNRAVLMEKKVGAGSIVLSTSSHFFSNEAMLRGRQLPLLTWLVGNSKHIVFDEFHHGLKSSRSVTSLLRTYNLHGVILLLFLVAILFLWRNSSSLLPRIPEDMRKIRPLTGRDQFEGMVGLLRSHAPKNLIRTAFEQWKRENRDWCRTHQTQLTEIEQLIHTQTKLTEEKEVAHYQTISRLLHPENQPHNAYHE